jgi:hypothetical protein
VLFCLADKLKGKNKLLSGDMSYKYISLQHLNKYKPSENRDYGYGV